MQQNEIRQIPLTALFAATGIILPQFFHLIGLGPTFLPMFLPIVAGSLLLTWKFALTLAILTPVTSFLITSMPPIIPPILPVMLVELISLSMICSILRVHRQQSVWVAMIPALIIDRILLFIIVSIVAPLFGLDHPLFSLALVAGGIPGIILMILTLPPLLKLIRQKYPQYYNLNENEYIRESEE